MRKILFLLSVICLSLFSQQSKIVYLKLIPPDLKGRELYVGEKIKLKYSLLLFSNASLLDAEFIPNSDEKLARGVEILNPLSQWVKQEDDSFENTFIFKIKSPDFAIPSLKILAISEDGSYTDSSIADGMKMEAVELGGEFYSKLLAKKVKISNVRAKKYDEWNNILIFSIDAESENLDEFVLQNIQKQGFDGDVIRYPNEKMMGGVYYCVLPSQLQELKFSFFNLETLRYEDVKIPIVVKSDRVSTQSDLEPKNTFLIFSNLVVVLLAVLAILLAFYFRSSKKVAILFVGIALSLIGYLAYVVFTIKKVKIDRDAVVRILPTENSTILQRTNTPLIVEVIGQHKQFYKIKLDEQKIGWIKKEDCRE